MCPWAGPASEAGRVRIVTSLAESEEGIYDDLAAEAERLPTCQEPPQGQAITTLLVCPYVKRWRSFDDFHLFYGDVLSSGDAFVKELGLKVVAFHPACVASDRDLKAGDEVALCGPEGATYCGRVVEPFAGSDEDGVELLTITLIGRILEDHPGAGEDGADLMAVQPMTEKTLYVRLSDVLWLLDESDSWSDCRSVIARSPRPVLHLLRSSDLNRVDDDVRESVLKRNVEVVLGLGAVEVRDVGSGDVVACVRVLPGQLVSDLKLALEVPSRTPARYQRLSDDSERVLGDADIVRADTTVFLLRVSAEPQDFVHACRDAVGGISELEWTYMVERGADVNALADEDPARPLPEDEFGGLAGGCFYGSTIGELGSSMLEATALHFAAKNGLAEVVGFLLDCENFVGVNLRCSNVSFRNQDLGYDLGMTAAMVAVISDEPGIASSILSCGHFTAVNDSYNVGCSSHRRNIFSMAALKGQAEVCRAILQHPDFADLALVDDYDVTVLMLAALRNTPGNAEVCKLILEDQRFPDELVNASSCTGGSDQWNGTALHFAARAGLVDVCHLLLRHKGMTAECVNAKTSGGTALHFAAGAGNEELCRLLLTDERFTAVMATGSWEPDAGFGSGNCATVTALELAEKAGLSEVCDMIRSHPSFGQTEPTQAGVPSSLVSAAAERLRRGDL